MEEQKSKKKKREHGTGGIYYVTSKNIWLAKITINGKAKTKTFRTEKEAKKGLKDLIRDQKNLASCTKWNTSNISEYMENWIKQYKFNALSPKSYDSLEYDIHHYVIPYIGGIALSSVTTNDIQDMINSLAAQGRSLSTIKRAYSAIRSCLNQAVSNIDIPFNPSLSAKLPSVKSRPSLAKAPISILREDEIVRYISVATSVDKRGSPNYRLGWGLVLILSTGMRREEALALKWSDYNEKGKCLYIHRTFVSVKNRDKNATTKTKEIIQEYTKSDSGTRTIPLNQTAELALSQLHSINGAYDYIFSTSKNTIVSIRNFNRMHYNILDVANIPHASVKRGIHCLRHTFCSHLIMSGVDIKTISEIMGHAEIATTLNIYGHLLQSYKSATVINNDFVADILKKNKNERPNQ